MLKLIGVDTPFKAPSMLDQPIINAQDFRGEAYGVLARAQQAQLESRKNQVINNASTALALSQKTTSSSVGGVVGGSSTGASGRGGGGSSEFDPRLDVSEREKFEYQKQKEAAALKLDYDKFGQSVATDQRDYVAGRDDEFFDRSMETTKFEYDVSQDQQKRQDEILEKAKTEFQAQQYAQAQQDVQELMLASEGLMRSGGGLEAIRGNLAKIFQAYPGISPEKQAEIVSQVYETPKRVNRTQIEKTETKIEEVQQFQRNTVLQAKRLELQSLTAGLKTATGSQRQKLIDQLGTKLNEFSSADADPLTKAMVLSGLYEEIANKGEVGADVQQKLLNYANYTQEASKLFLQRNNMSPSQYSLQESMLQQKYGVDGGFRLNDSNFDNKVAMDTLRTTTDLRELRTRNALDEKFGIGASRAAIAELAKANLDPARIEALKAMAARYGNPPGLVEAAKLAEDMYNHRTKSVDVQTKISTLEKEAAMLQASDAQTVLNMLEGGASSANMQNLITTAMLSQANPKLAEALQSGGKIPPEVKAQIQAQWTQQRARIINEINIQKRLLETSHAIERDYLESYFSKDNFAALDAVRQQMPQLRTQMNQQSQIGVSRSAQQPRQPIRVPGSEAPTPAPQALPQQQQSAEQFAGSALRTLQGIPQPGATKNVEMLPSIMPNFRR